MSGRAGDERVEDVLRLALAIGEAPDPEEIVVEERDERLMARLPGDLMAWLPANPEGAARLAIDRQVLGLIAERCRFRAPRVLHVGPDGGDIRRMVAGNADPWGMVERLKVDRGLAAAVGAQLGRILADQHGRIAATDVRPWLRERVSWPEPQGWIAPRLRQVIADRTLLARMEAVLEHYFGTPVAERDRVLVHGDFGLHNIAFGQNGSIEGIFDYDGAAWDDFHHDFRYLEFERGHTVLLEAAVAVYEAASGRAVDRGRVDLLNAVSAICFLANRDGVAPEVNWCGRTLAEDMRWVTDALARVG